MKNFQVTDRETGKTYWISRSVVTLAIVIVTDEPNGPQYRTSYSPKCEPWEDVSSVCKSSSTDDNGAYDTLYSYTIKNNNYIQKKYIVINKRGIGCPSHIGEWNIPCGYLDWDETLTEAATREVLEENNLYINPKKWTFYGINDTVRSKQDVTIRQIANITMDEYKEGLITAMSMTYAGEPNEVAETELMELTKENLESHKFAFNHNEIIAPFLEKVIYIY